MTFENEFFEMAQALEENSDMLNISNKLSDTQVPSRLISSENSVVFPIETCSITFKNSHSIIEKSRTSHWIE